MLDERSLRRPTFLPGVVVRLADGQDWHLRKPVVRFVPHPSDCGFRLALTASGDDDFQDLLDALDAAFGDAASARVGEVARAELAIGRAMLLANYDLTPELVATVLQFGYDPEADPERSQVRRSVIEAALGRGGERTASRWRRCVAYAFGRLPWGDGMALEDFLEASAWMSWGRPPKVDRWVDEIRHRASADSFAGIG